MNDIDGRSAREIFGSPDDLKLRSSATLFSVVSGEEVFEEVLRKYFGGERDEETLRRLPLVNIDLAERPYRRDE